MLKNTVSKLAFLVAIVSATSGLPVGPAYAGSGLTTLQPGGVREISQNLTVSIVFVGYQPGSGTQRVDAARLVAGLPAHADPLARTPRYYGILRSTHVHYNLSYRTVFADATFNDAFFGYLSGIATARPVASYQQAYNGQQARTLTVTNNVNIDANATESWLASHAGPMLGVDTSRYTVFLINWFGRPDFRFHVYSHVGDVNPDTGMDRGLRDGVAMSAWGGTSVSDRETPTGTPRRIWFFDQSAGPDAFDWIIDATTEAQTGAGYSIPPVWEYGNTSGYRPFTDLTGDLGKLVRYVAIDCLFFTSPVYNPMLSAPKLPDSIELDLNTIEADPASDARSLVSPPEFVDRIGRLVPELQVSSATIDHAYSGRLADVYQCWKHAWDVYVNTGNYFTAGCYGRRDHGYALSDMFLYSYADNLPQFITGHGDYDLPILDFHTSPDRDVPLGGLADDNYHDGTQTYVFADDRAGDREIGGGVSDLIVHEVGHHLGMSHPFDGYDSETGVDFGPYGRFFFTLNGEWSSTVMGYAFNEYDFSQFNLDDRARWMTAGYINQSNAILARIYATPNAGKAANLIANADQQATNALAAYAAMDYAGSLSDAHAAYRGILAAAAAAGVSVEPETVVADIKARAPDSRFIDVLPPLR